MALLITEVGDTIMKIYPKFTESELNSLGLQGQLPGHIGIIMDGNGRWANSRLLPRNAGHRAGMEALQEIVRFSHSIGIKALTVYAFSTENWGRPEREVNALFSLLVEYFNKAIEELKANNVQIRILGDPSRFSSKLQFLINSAVEDTRNNTGLVLSIAINYGSRDEITRAIKNIIREGITADEINDKKIEEHLYTHGLPELDLIIRTAGEQRLSNFLLWQAAYSEFVFTPTCFPDFSPEIYMNCIREFMQRTRRFGKVK